MATMTFSGLASGIDTASLIEATIAQKRAVRIKPLETKISQYQETNSAYTELKKLLQNLKDSADKFRTIKGSGVAMEVYSSDETVLTATIGGSATAGNYEIIAQQLARNGNFSFASSGRTYTSLDAAINPDISSGGSVADRSVNFTIGSGASAENINIEVTGSTTLAHFVSEFNSQSESATASIINKGTTSNPNYVVMVSSKNEGMEKGSITVTVGAAILNSGEGAFNDNTASEAQDAVFSLSGIGGTITRQSNTINDVIAGVSFKLQQQGSSTISIGIDNDTTTEYLQDLIDSYNEIVEYITENDRVSEEDNSIVYGSLSKTSLDENILSTLRSALSTLSGSGSIHILADLGITTKRDGTLAFDKDLFVDAIEKDGSGVATILQNMGDTLANTGGIIDRFTSFNGLLDSAVNSNLSSITRFNERISVLEGQLSREEQSLTNRFAQLEALLGNLQQQQTSLSALLPMK
jgi:flagellar hook-associated protein 2